MFLFNLADIVQVPFGYLMDYLYQFTRNYGWALILFSVFVKLILLPTTVKSKRSMMKMSRLTPQLQEIQKKYENDQQKQTAAMQELYKREGVSMGGGCLWSLLPLLILIPLYTVVREPLTYILHQSSTAVYGINGVGGLLNAVKDAGISGVEGVYGQMVAAANLNKLDPTVIQGIEGITNAARVQEGLNFHFLFGIDLAAMPQFNVFNSAVWKWDWPHIGGFLLPVLAATMQVLTMVISQKVNNSLITDEKGLQDKEAAKNSQAAKSGKVMMYIMPIMTLFIGFSMPAAMSLYWLVQGVVGAVVDNLLTVKLRKEYDAEDAVRLQKAMEEERIEQEKERIRAERRAANPDGITQNTSKKKLQQKQQREQDAAKAAAKKDFNAKRGIVEEEPEAPKPLSGIVERPFCKGRNYNPDRYTTDATEEE